MFRRQPCGLSNILVIPRTKRDPQLQEWTKIGIFTFYSCWVFFHRNFLIKLILIAYKYLSVILAEFEQLAFIGPDIVVIPLFTPIFDCICYVITLCTKNKQHTVIEKQISKYEATSIESFFSFRRYIVEKKW